ncbi:hypothetical protein J6590_071330 [Homalodisca vitripennis]|nr:hypothetical protein J6590_071330 [Homalodisca vitripennis]
MVLNHQRQGRSWMLMNNPNEDLHPPKSDNASLVPFSIISPLPCPKKTSKKPNSRKQHSSILTLTPNKIKLELAALEKEERNKRKENNNLKKASKKVLKPKGKSNYRKSDSKLFKPKHEVTKAKKNLCRRNISFSSSEDEDKCKEIILCDDNEMDDVDLLRFGNSGAISEKELPTEAGCCLLCGEIGRDSELWFRFYGTRRRYFLALGISLDAEISSSLGPRMVLQDGDFLIN